jgi:hypothetical protein
VIISYENNVLAILVYAAAKGKLLAVGKLLRLFGRERRIARDRP